MKIVLSPAKQLNLQAEYLKYNYTLPPFTKEAQKLINVLKQKSPKEIKSLMKISDSLAELNWKRYQEWQSKATDKARPAIFTFDGAVYRGFDIWTIPSDKLPAVNDYIRILSGLYGILHPFDLIYPYRLEMGSKLQFENYKNLYAYWRDKVTAYLQQEMDPEEILVNLASQEYFKVIDTKKLNRAIIDIEFKEFKDEKLKTITIYTKTARGRMARFIVLNKVNSIDELKLFNWDGYAFDANLSTEKKLVFTR